MRHYAYGADHPEYQKSCGDQITESFVVQQLDVLDANQNVEFAFPKKARAEPVRHFAQANRPSRRGNDVQKDLESNRRDRSYNFLQELAIQDEKSTHRVGQGALTDRIAETPPELAQTNAPDG